MRRILAALLIAVSVALAPAAVVGAWARAQLVDTERFVQTLAPLAERPEIQSFITDQAVQAIDERIDIDGLVNDLFGGLEGLPLPDRAIAALSLLEAPAAEGVRTVLHNTVEGIVTSPRFAQIFEATLRQTHSTAIGLLQNDPDRVLQLGDDGVISISLANLIRETKAVLIEQGFALARLIPEIDRSIPLMTASALPLVRDFYHFVVAVGAWLPWLVLGMLVLGVVLAVNRRRTLLWTGVALAGSFVLALTGFIIGVTVFSASVSPGPLPAEVAHAIFTQVTGAMRTTFIVLLASSIMLAVGCALAGDSRFMGWLRSERSSQAA